MPRRIAFVALATTLAPNLQATPAPSHIKSPSEVIERLTNVRARDFAERTKKNPYLVEPLIRMLWAGQLFTHSDWKGIQGLLSISHRIDPGTSDDASNMFVYTCRGGWLDVGHVIYNALAYKAFLQALRGSKLVTKDLTQFLIDSERVEFDRVVREGPRPHDYAYWAGYFTARVGANIEAYQMALKNRTPRRQWDGNATSAYTLEDLPSNYFGLQLGMRLESRKATVRGVVKAFESEFRLMMRDLGGVELHTKTLAKGCPATAEIALKRDGHCYMQIAETSRVTGQKSDSTDPRSPYNYTRRPKPTLSHRCVCR